MQWTIYSVPDCDNLSGVAFDILKIFVKIWLQKMNLQIWSTICQSISS